MAISIVQFNNNLKTLDFLTESGWHKVAYEDFSDEVKSAVDTINAATLNLRSLSERQLDAARQEQRKLADENATVKQENATVKQENANVKAQNEQLTETNEALKIAVNRMFSSTEAAEYIKKYPEYQVGKQYGQGEVLRYNGKLYITVQPHTSQADWAPDSVPALYVPFEVVGEHTNENGSTSNIQEFKQPTGAHDAYKKGDKVRFEGKVYESLIDNNAYSPTAYPQGWKEVK